VIILQKVEKLAFNDAYKLKKRERDRETTNNANVIKIDNQKDSLLFIK